MIGLAWIGLSVLLSCVILRHLPDSIRSDLPDKRRWQWVIVGELNRIFASLIVPEIFSEGFDRRAGRHEVEVCLVCRIREKYTPLPQDWLTPLQSLRCNVEPRSLKSFGSRASDSWLVEKRLQCTR